MLLAAPSTVRAAPEVGSGMGLSVPLVRTGFGSFRFSAAWVSAAGL
jgi:hypothetical protein